MDELSAEYYEKTVKPEMEQRERMKKKFMFLIKLTVAVCISLALLSCFCLVYDYNGCSIHNATGATDYKRKPFQFTTNMEEGFCFKRADQYGFYNTEQAVADHPQILLMGSSHMEADQMRNEENVGALLGEYFTTFNMGLSGDFICPCIARMDAAVQTYQPTDFVILETFTCHPDLEEMRKTIDEPVTSTGERSHFLEAVSTYCPSIVNLYYALQNWYNAGKIESSPRKQYTEPDGVNIENNTPVSEEEFHFSEEDIKNDGYASTLDELIQKAVLPVKQNGNRLIIFYHPGLEINPDGTVKEENLEEKKEIALFQQVCENNDVIFADMTDAFTEFYQKEHQLPNGFWNTAVGKGHLNKDGHRVIADVLIQLLEERGL